MKLVARLVAVALSLVGAGNVFAGASAAEVEAAISKAKRWLYSQQKDGNWELQQNSPKQPYPDNNKSDGGQWGGRTAIAVYALLDAGESARDEKLAPAIEFLKKAHIEGTYALAMRSQVWLLLPKTQDNLAGLRKDAAALVASMKTGAEAGLWGYTFDPKSKEPKDYSHSRSQYGVLGLWAAAQRDVETPNSTWEKIEAVWIKHQDVSGGWTYKAPKETEHACTPGMTAAGVATLYLTSEMLHLGEAPGKANPVAPAIERGLEWLTKNADKYAAEGYSRDFPYATMYTFERAAQASGYKYLGGMDWYDRGATWAIKKQGAEGNWASRDHLFAGGDTCFAMLFLVHGRAPVVFNKLQYSVTPADGGKARERVVGTRGREILPR